MFDLVVKEDFLDIKKKIKIHSGVPGQGGGTGYPWTDGVQRI